MGCKLVNFIKAARAKILIYSVLMVSLSAHGQAIQIQQLDESFDVKELEKSMGAGAKVKTLKALNKEKDSTKLPSNREVTLMLKKAGLETEAKTFDSLAKDQLYLRAGYFNIDQLANLYPKSSKDNLNKLIELVLLQKKTDGAK